MKKYRITKITVKTREIVSMSKSPTDENRFSVCPVCQNPLGEASAIDEKSVEKIRDETQSERLSETGSNKNEKLKN